MARKVKKGYNEPPTHDTMKLRRLVKPRSENQRAYMDALSKYTYVFGVGPPGTGKTFLAVSYALRMLQTHQIERIIITRPNISTDEEMGFLPGDINEKMAPWTRPIKDAVMELAGAATAQKLFANETIEVCPLGHMKGRTFKNAVIIADEMSNSTPNQMESLLTRLGEGSVMIVLGDPNQSDLPDSTLDGLSDFLDVYHSTTTQTQGLSVVYLHREDIQRHPLIPMILDIYSGGDVEPEPDEFEVGLLLE